MKTKFSLLLVIAMGIFFTCCSGGVYDYNQPDPKVYGDQDPSEFTVLWGEYPKLGVGESYGRVTKIQEPNAKDEDQRLHVTVAIPGGSGEALRVPKNQIRGQLIRKYDIVKISGTTSEPKLKKQKALVQAPQEYNILQNPNPTFAGRAPQYFIPNYEHYGKRKIVQIIEIMDENGIPLQESKDAENQKRYSLRLKSKDWEWCQNFHKTNLKKDDYHIYDILEVVIVNGQIMGHSKPKDQVFEFIGGEDDAY